MLERLLVLTDQLLDLLPQHGVLQGIHSVLRLLCQELGVAQRVLDIKDFLGSHCFITSRLVCAGACEIYGPENFFAAAVLLTRAVLK